MSDSDRSSIGFLLISTHRGSFCLLSICGSWLCCKCYRGCIPREYHSIFGDQWLGSDSPQYPQSPVPVGQAVWWCWLPDSCKSQHDKGLTVSELEWEDHATQLKGTAYAEVLSLSTSPQDTLRCSTNSLLSNAQFTQSPEP